jgi:hypothetical protein
MTVYICTSLTGPPKYEFGRPQNVFYGNTNGNFTADLKNARRRLACLNTLVSIARKSRDIMGKQHPSFLGSPFQYRWVIRS